VGNFFRVFFIIFSLQRIYKTSFGKVFLDDLKLKIPLFGDIALKGEIARLTRTFSLLVSSGLAVVVALKVTIVQSGTRF
jgi:type IV pilus assembly protein PilC